MPRSTAPSRRPGRSDKPLLLYWGAKWCPPCNQLKATLFNRQDFIERSRAFVPVYVDGDLPGAQKLGARFKVRGYPTLILFKPEGAEITRLPGEVDAPQVMQVLQLGLAGGRPVRAVLADARRPASRSTPNEWRLLAYYSWDTDEEQLVPAPSAPACSARSPAACPAQEAEAATRLWLKALAASDDGQGVKADAALRERVHEAARRPGGVAHADGRADNLGARDHPRHQRPGQPAASAPSSSPPTTRPCSASRPTRRCRAPTAWAR